MHFEILVEDQSGKKALETIVPEILGNDHTFTIRWYKGIGKIPKNLKSKNDADKRILLAQLPKLLQGYGNAFSKYPSNYAAVVILVCDLDSQCLVEFRNELDQVLEACEPRPETRFCIAIEEGEAWLLGDLDAVRTAYPKAKESVLSGYVSDSICGTWECLADALHPGGAEKLKSQGWQAVGAAKSQWAEEITPHMDIEKNRSPSFNYFREQLLELAAEKS